MKKATMYFSFSHNQSCFTGLEGGHGRLEDWGIGGGTDARLGSSPAADRDREREKEKRFLHPWPNLPTHSQWHKNNAKSFYTSASTSPSFLAAPQCCQAKDFALACMKPLPDQLAFFLPQIVCYTFRRHKTPEPPMAHVCLRLRLWLSIFG